MKIAPRSLILKTAILSLTLVNNIAAATTFDDRNSNISIIDTCQFKLPTTSQFAPHEIQAWNQYLCLNLPLKMNHLDGNKDSNCDVYDWRNWQDSRTLSSKFIEFALHSRESDNNKRVFSISCAIISDNLNIRKNTYQILTLDKSVVQGDIRIDRNSEVSEIHIEESIIRGNTQLKHVNISGSIVIRRTHAEGDIKLERSNVKHDVIIKRSTLGGSLDLTRSKIGGDLAFVNRSQIDGSLTAFRTQIGGSLLSEGTLFKRNVNLREASIGGDVRLLRRTRVEGDFAPVDAEIERNVALEDAQIRGNLNASSIRIKGGLRLGIHGGTRKRTTYGKDVILDSAQIDGRLLLANADVGGRFSLNGAEVGDEIRISPNVVFEREVSFIDAITGSAILNGSRFRNGLIADRMQIRGSLYLTDYTTFSGGTVKLNGTVIKGQLDARRAVFRSPVQAERLSVQGSAFLNDGAVFVEPVFLHEANIGLNLDVSGSTFKKELELNGSKIRGALILTSNDRESSIPKWEEEAQFILSNVEVKIVHDAPSAWCRQGDCATHGFVSTDLTNFVYAVGGSVEARQAKDPLSSRELDWYLSWINSSMGQQDRFNPQPYRQLANVLRSSGDPGKADRVLYELQNYELSAANTPWQRKFILWLKWLFIGYGYENWRSLIPLVIVIAAGAFFCRFAEELADKSWIDKLWYSIDRAVPVIDFGTDDIVVTSNEYIRLYFQIHKLLGFVLISFLIAGLSGFAK